MRWPKLPRTVFSALGPMPVLGGGNPEDMGEVDFAKRTVKLTDGMHPAAAWDTYWHECVHIALYEAGIANLLPDESEETICDAIGLYLSAATRAGFISVHEKP